MQASDYRGLGEINVLQDASAQGCRPTEHFITGCYALEGRSPSLHINITKTRPCNIQQYFTAVKMFIFR